MGKNKLYTNPKLSISYVAVEEKARPWPLLANREDQTAGPFYLIWPNPERSEIGTEEWPYQLISFEIKNDFRKLYPDIFPDPKLRLDHPVIRGLHTFQTHCFACHTLNKNGTAQMGPDLNVPMNPTEYLTEAILRKLIRNYQDVRYFPQAKMYPNDETKISNKELDDLMAYLRHMASRKRN